MDIRLNRKFEKSTIPNAQSFQIYQPISGWGLASNIRRAGVSDPDRLACQFQLVMQSVFMAKLSQTVMSSPGFSKCPGGVLCSVCHRRIRLGPCPAGAPHRALGCAVACPKGPPPGLAHMIMFYLLAWLLQHTRHHVCHPHARCCSSVLVSGLYQPGCPHVFAWSILPSLGMQASPSLGYMEQSAT